VSELDTLRHEVARITRRGIGMTLAACLYWLGLALVTALAGLQPPALAAFFIIGTVLVYPLGWLLDRWCGGDLFARGHPLSGLVAMLAATEALGLPMMALLFRDEPTLLAFALAAMLGAHFVPFGWLYRSPAYYALGIGTVVLSALLQWFLPQQAPLLVPVAMTLCYALAVAAVWREVRVAERV
jgi:GNAT superfamily N-acetyltransferase